MNASDWKLRRLPISLRLAVAALVACLAIGEAASLYHLVKHHEKRDDQPGLSMADLEGAYRGVDRPARLRAVLDAPHGREKLPDAKERAALAKWLAGAKVNEEYDSLDAGELAPAEILARRCVACHARSPKDVAGAKGIGATLPLEFWDDVAKVAFAKRIDPVPVEILALSAHVHALTMPLLAFVVGVLALATSFPPRAMRLLVSAGCVGLFVDLASWWLARGDVAALAAVSGPVFVPLLVAGGALFGGALALQLLLVMLDLLLPTRATPPSSKAPPG